MSMGSARPNPASDASVVASMGAPSPAASHGNPAPSRFPWMPESVAPPPYWQTRHPDLRARTEADRLAVPSSSKAPPGLWRASLRSSSESPLAAAQASAGSMPSSSAGSARPQRPGSPYPSFATASRRERLPPDPSSGTWVRSLGMAHSPQRPDPHTATLSLYPHDETVGDLAGWDEEGHSSRTGDAPRSCHDSWIGRASECMRTSLTSMATSCLRPGRCADDASVRSSGSLASLDADLRSHDRSRLLARLAAQQSMGREDPLEPDPMSRFARLAVEQRLQEGLPMPPAWEAMRINPAGLLDRPTVSEFERYSEYLNASDRDHERKDQITEGTPARLSFSDIDEPR